MNIFDYTLFSKPTCLPCCTGNPTACSCALLIPPNTTPYASYATASTAIATYVSNCVAYSNPPFANDTFNADSTTTANTLVLNNTIATHFSASWYSSLNLKAGTLSSAFSISSADTGGTYVVGGILYNCTDYSTVASDSIANSLTGTLTFSVPSLGEYILYLYINNLE